VRWLIDKPIATSIGMENVAIVSTLDVVPASNGFLLMTRLLRNCRLRESGLQCQASDSNSTRRVGFKRVAEGLTVVTLLTETEPLTGCVTPDPSTGTRPLTRAGVFVLIDARSA
jgi:hypothetical protein